VTLVDDPRGAGGSGLSVEVRGVGQVVRGGRRTLDDVSLSVRPGELVAIIGASGAGKTTLLDALSGMRPPASGTLRHDGMAGVYGRLAAAPSWESPAPPVGEPAKGETSVTPARPPVPVPVMTPAGVNWAAVAVRRERGRRG
jgi:hypothetical protein